MSPAPTSHSLGPPSDPSGRYPRTRLLADVLIGLGVTAALTVLFWVTELDLRWQALAYSQVEPHWPHGRLPGWVLIYHFGTLPGLMLSVLAAVGLGLSFLRTEFVRWRYPCLFLVLLLALGPGLLINLLAKGFGGRPRPDQILEFGGLLPFRYPFQPGLPHKGFSFLCGHCSMGFMFMGLFFLLRGWKRWAGLLGGLLFGLLQGVGRMVQGAHFASDALLGASVMFTLAAALAPVAAWQPQTGAERRHRLKVAGATALLIVLMVGGFLFSMPVREENVHVWLEPGQARAATGEGIHLWRARRDAPNPAKVLVEVEVGDISIAFRPQLEPMLIRSRVTGFAFPGAASPIAAGYLGVGGGIFYRQRLSGLFAEKHGSFDVSLREELVTDLAVATRDGQIVLVGPFPARPLAVRGSFELSDPGGRLTRVAEGGYTCAGVGAPITLVLEAQRVLVRP
jgi:membrane-associated PAP2 superfamily phosphatase